VVVEVASGDEFAGEMIEDGDAAVPRRYGAGAIAPPKRLQGFAILGPGPGALLEPAFPVEPPPDFLLEFFDGGGRVPGTDGGENLFFEEDAGAGRRGEARDVLMPGYDEIPNAAIVGRERKEGLEPGEGFGSGGGEKR
jgi:hypothetical protein